MPELTARQECLIRWAGKDGGWYLVRGRGLASPARALVRKSLAARVIIAKSAFIRLTETGMALAKKLQEEDDKFMSWCESWKPCAHCRHSFWGPVCDCEMDHLGRE